jgi:putative ABC transport system substrate-binding protein
MNRRTFVTGIGALLAAPLGAGAQQAGKIPMIGVLWTSSPSLLSSFEIQLRQGLHELGYTEGQNIVLENRYGENSSERLQGFATELVRARVDVIVTQGTPAALAAKKATGTIPIVITQVGDPIGSGLISGLARPGQNITGLTNAAAELSAKRLQILKETIPGLSRVALMWDAGGGTVPGDPYGRKATEDVAPALSLTVLTRAVEGPADFSAAFTRAIQDRAQAIIVLPSPLLGVHAKSLVALAARHRLPAMYQSKPFVEAGGLISYGASVADIYRRAAVYVNKILKGAKPADLPVEEPTKFELLINLRTAKALGLTIPPSLLLRADQVIE